MDQRHLADVGMPSADVGMLTEEAANAYKHTSQKECNYGN